MTNLKLKYSKIFKEKFKGNTITTNIVDTSANPTTDINVTYFNRRYETKKKFN